MHDFRRLQVWQRGRALVVVVDTLTRNFPRADRGVFAGQLRRAVLSIPSNIAEGCGKSSRKETIRFLQIATGSAAEAESHTMIAADLHYITPKASESLLSELKSIQRMLKGLIANLSEGGPHSGS